MNPFRVVPAALAAAALSCAAGTTTRADWNIGDPYKMHYPQLPDPNGWDVNCTVPNNLADDFLCTETGFITDVHIWGSWKDDLVGTITAIRLSIHGDVPATPTSPSHPGPAFWTQTITDPALFHVRPWSFDSNLPQGWLDCTPGVAPIPNNHGGTWQLNITNIPNPCFQERGSIYWLDVSVLTQNGLFGWKTALDDSAHPHFNDDGVWGLLPGGLGGPSPIDWLDLHDPATQRSMDLAFVITPAPGTLVPLLLGAAPILLRRRS